MGVDGFISVVEKKPGDEYLCVRSRERMTLERVCEKVGVDPEYIEEDGGTDYEYRVWMTRPEVKRYMVSLIDELDYGNFKNRVSAVHGKEAKYVTFLMDVWQAGFKVLGKPFSSYFEEDFPAAD